VPHLLCAYFSWFTRKRFGVIVHEQSQQSLKAYVAELLILLSANRLIFTNHFERSYAIKRIPFMARRSTVVKIFSNIARAEAIRSVAERPIDVVNFGQIMPRKGIERFIDDVAPLAHKYKIVIAGKTPLQFTDYYQKIEKLCQRANIELQTDLGDVEVSGLLDNSKLAYLPFPDGVSERRGSLFAAMVNGAVVATTFGRFTTPALAKATIDIAKTSLENILLDENLLLAKQQAAQDFMQTQMPHGWDEIAKSYDDFMKK
jgi:glycosyltransferase involved in cell wall biosynthesis